jgi:hypothetical protein
MIKDIKIKSVVKTVEYISNVPKFINQSPSKIFRNVLQKYLEMLNLELNF